MNIASYIEENAKKFPFKRAVVFPQTRDAQGRVCYSHYTFKRLNEMINIYANALSSLGVEKGVKTLIFVRPSLDLSALVFALFKMGAVPILIDPGMGRKNLLKSIAQVEPQVLISVPEVDLFRAIFKKPFRSVKTFITTGRFSLFGAKKLNEIIVGQSNLFESVNCSPDDMAAILFTSGGTGRPKGVVYTHNIFDTQIRLLREMFNLNDNDIDLPGFPLFSLFTMAMGMTSTIPDMDPTKPAKVDPKKIVETILDHGVTFAAGSPAIWERVANHCLKNEIVLPSIKYLVMFGAPVANSIHQKFAKILISGTTYTPYGATESLPVANISGSFILQNTAIKTDMGEGTCVGKPVDGCSIKIIKTADTSLDQILELATGEIGEIIVSGEMVTAEYYRMDHQTHLAKIIIDGVLWHRMGDMGYLDAQGMLWFCGRKAHRVELDQSQTLYSVKCEAIFNQHSEVKRSALVGVRKDNKITPGIVVERIDHRTKLDINSFNSFINELKILGQKYSHTSQISSFYLFDHFPVDVRHNIKIDRLALRNWVEKNE